MSDVEMGPLCELCNDELEPRDTYHCNGCGITICFQCTYGIHYKGDQDCRGPLIRLFTDLKWKRGDERPANPTYAIAVDKSGEYALSYWNGIWWSYAQMTQDVIPKPAAWLAIADLPAPSWIEEKA